MRHQWHRLLHLRAHLRYSPHVFSNSSHSQVNSQSNFHSISVFSFSYPINPRNPITRNLSSEPALETKPSDDLSFVAEIFSRLRDEVDISKELESSNVELSHDFVLSLLKSLESSPDVARRVFDWVCRDKNWNSKWYNQMLCILGVNGDVEGFWKFFYVMKNKRGYGVEGWVRDRVLERFEENGLEDDAKMLRAVSTDSSAVKACLKMCKIIAGEEVWSDDIERKLLELDVVFSSDVVVKVMEYLNREPMKALMCFRWVEEAGLLMHNQQTYNAVARVLGRKDCMDRFWEVVHDMRSNGFELELETYIKVLGRCRKWEVPKDAVDLYEFAMAGANKPSEACTTSLLKKIVVAKELDMDLFSRVVRIYTENGNAGTNTMLSTALKSLVSVGRLAEGKKVFKVMEESMGDKEDEASDFINIIIQQVLGSDLQYKAWLFLIKGCCIAGDLEKAFDCFQKMIESEGAASVSSAFNLVVNAYCRQNRATDAYKFLTDLVSKRQLKPWRTTYKLLISKLLAQGELSYALHVLGMVKNDGFPLIIYPFIMHVSKSGTSDDAIACLKTIESKGVAFVSTAFNVVVNAYCRKNRATDAYKFLSDLVSKRQLKPWRTTYKLLISKLLAQGEVRDALRVLGMMKNDGFPLIIYPFIKHVSKSGTGDDAVACPKTMASREFPSIIVFLQVFTTYFKAGLCCEAHDFFSKCPGYIRNHADVLNLCPGKSGEGSATSVVFC